jgi:SNF2 family DNA or RNA helicase
VKWSPTPYQRRAVRHLLAEPAAGLMLKPGYRKTSCVLRAFKTMLTTQTVDRMLVMAPLSVASTVWQEETAKWDFSAGMRVELLHGPKKEQALARPAEIQVINYEGLAWLDRQRGYQWPQMLVADESTKIKSTKTQRFNTLRPHLRAAHRRVALTGSPSTNGLIDLFGQLYFLDLGERLHPYITRFRNEFFTQIDMHKWVPHPDAEERIAERIGDICFTLRKGEELKLPALNEVRRPVKLPTKASAQYAQLEALFLTQLEEGVVTAANAAVKSGKLRQLCGGAIYVDAGEKEWGLVHDAKLEALGDLLEELGAPAIVVYEFNHERERIEDYFGDGSWAVDRVAGTPKQRKAAIFKWNMGALDILLCHPAAAGHGINLQDGGENVVFYSPTWNLEHHEQTIGRLHRSGQKNPVTAYTLVCQNTIEERVVSAREAKARSQGELLDYIRKWRR